MASNNHTDDLVVPDFHVGLNPNGDQIVPTVKDIVHGVDHTENRGVPPAAEDLENAVVPDISATRKGEARCKKEAKHTHNGWLVAYAFILSTQGIRPEDAGVDAPVKGQQLRQPSKNTVLTVNSCKQQCWATNGLKRWADRSRRHVAMHDVADTALAFVSDIEQRRLGHATERNNTERKKKNKKNKKKGKGHGQMTRTKTKQQRRKRAKKRTPTAIREEHNAVSAPKAADSAASPHEDHAHELTEHPVWEKSMMDAFSKYFDNLCSLFASDSKKPKKIKRIKRTKGQESRDTASGEPSCKSAAEQAVEAEVPASAEEAVDAKEVADAKEATDIEATVNTEETADAEETAGAEKCAKAEEAANVEEIEGVEKVANAEEATDAAAHRDAPVAPLESMTAQQSETLAAGPQSENQDIHALDTHTRSPAGMLSPPMSPCATSTDGHELKLQQSQAYEAAVEAYSTPSASPRLVAS
ncbi:hypothetical protein THASP1DRAFT_28653 [Thamnocephalis sphaerospora]|uniref:Uncharacterized protein n=1 Tax=Thamnocephalis sphaerospora TaxID=78915 RepID=A0A4P9XVC7_9FUNG|nr:hypothetical protein THASP1DRAFT_28653 [Thamnocephalis sphaerospora]|eukprot:RKP09551.1 hypothetical protein THASP1DRAFT_28653 [Thamnocephalis sphaerospora]